MCVQARRAALFITTLVSLAAVSLVLASLSGPSGAALAERAKPQAEIHVCASGCIYTTVQAAINAAADGDVILIAAGVYSDVTTIGGLTQIAYVTKTLTLRGGYNAAFSAWNPANFTTTLDAHAAGRVVYAKGDITVTLEGLQLVNGFHSASGAGIYAESAALQVLGSVIANNRMSPNFHGNYGVGLYLADGSLIMQDSVVQGNQPLPGGDYSHDGGGLYAINAMVEIRDSQFLSNTAAFGTASCGTGGGILLRDSVSLLQGVTFRNNVATGCNGGGGGLWTLSGSLRLLDSTFEGNTNGGAALHTAGSLIAGNVFSGNVGNGLSVSAWVQQVVNITVTHNLLQNNTGRGLIVPVAAISILVEDNDFIGNGSSGLDLWAKSNTGAATTVSVRDNLFQANTTTGDGGGARLIGAVDVVGNRFIGNHANGKGGGVYQGEYCSDGTSYSCQDNASAVYDANLFRGNSAAEGGGLYTRPQYSTLLNIAYRNLVFLDNTATTTGSALYFYRYRNTPVPFEHLTVANNTGGDGAMIFQMMGNSFFTDTLLYSGTIGLKLHSPTVTLDHVLRYAVLTPTVTTSGWGLTDRSPITATPAFAADGYHLTAASAAVDAGLATGISHDFDGQPRPLGTAPDIGADESPYSRADTGLQISQLADAPHWKVYYTGFNVPPSTYFEQNYVIPFAYYGPITSPQITAYSIRDDFPADLDLAATANPIDLVYTPTGHTLTWTAREALSPGDWGWVGVTGQSDSVTPGELLTNSGQLNYTLFNGQTRTVPFSATTSVPPRPVFPPVLISPLDGEMCLEAGNQLIARGVAGAGMIVHLYEDGGDRGQTTATSSGEFTLTWTSALTVSHPAISVYTVACEPGGGCSTPSRTVQVTYPQAAWCPQRSYWEGDAFGIHHTFYFRNDLGRYATNDFVLPGIFGFWNTQLHLYSCCDHNDTNPFKITADDVVYLTPSAHSGRWWTFDVGAAHSVIVETLCEGGGGGPSPSTSHGHVLIDPDGFVFDVNAGGHYDQVSGVFSPTQAVAGITVTAYVSVPEWGGWLPWPAQLYNNQLNPQVTGANGYFAFFTPPGFYYLQAESADGYQAWRSPVVEVITQIVHVNMPLTPWPDAAPTMIDLTPDGPDPARVVVPIGGRVEWRATIGAGAALTDLMRLSENPVNQPRTLGALDPLINVLGFDGGLLKPGQVYRRQFDQPGTYTYSDGQGHTGTIVVARSVYLPLLRK